MILFSIFCAGKRLLFRRWTIAGILSIAVQT